MILCESNGSLGSPGLITTVHFLRAREPFGVSSPLARLGSPTHSRSRFALTHLPPALPPYGSAKAIPRCTLLHQPSLRPGVFSPPCRQVRVDLGPALNRPSLQPPPGSALTLTILRPLVLPFHPRRFAIPVAATRRRRRRLLRTSPHPNPHLEDTSTLETPYRLAETTPESAT